MKKNNIIKSTLLLSLLLLILVGCNKKDLKEYDSEENLESSNIIISLEKDMEFPSDSSKNYIKYHDESVKETKDMEGGCEFDINVDENKIIMVKNLSEEPISVEIEDPNGKTYNDLNQESKYEYKLDSKSEKGLYKVKINFLNNKRIKLDLYMI